MIEYLGSFLNEKLFVVSTLAAAFAYFYKVRADSKRDARYVLYLLMDLRKVLLGYKLQMDKAGSATATMASEVLVEKGGEISEEQLDEAKEVLSQFFGDLNSILFKYKDQLFAERFEQALTELAKRDPIRAYRIRSHKFMVELADAQEKFFNKYVLERLKSDLDKSDTPPELLYAVKTAFEEVLDEERVINIEGFLKDLNKDLLSLGFSSGLGIFARTAYRIAFSDVKPVMTDLRSAMPEDLLDRVKKRYSGIYLAKAIEKHGLRPVNPPSP
tara:strand:+ start:1471 stop:2286 length:816 start_codon:yes stop_codon:yes gene_type:complete